MTETLFEPWPPWVQRPVGILLRIAGALGAVAFGAVLVFVGYFGASYKKTPAVWGTEEITFAVAGVAMAIAGVAWAVRPCRFTFFGAIGILGAGLFAGSVV